MYGHNKLSMGQFNNNNIKSIIGNVLFACLTFTTTATTTTIRWCDEERIQANGFDQDGSIDADVVQLRYLCNL